MTSPFCPWLTRQPLADRIAAWAWEGASGWAGDRIGSMRVLEPSAGRGALLLGLLKAGAEPSQLTGIELHRGRLDFLRAAFPSVKLVHRDFLSYVDDWKDELVSVASAKPFDLTVSNPPSDDGLDTEHVEAMLTVSRRVVVLVRLAFITGSDRQRLIFSKAKLSRMAVLSSRPDFIDDRSDEERAAAVRMGKAKTVEVAEGSPKHDWCVLDMFAGSGARTQPWDHVRVEWW